MYRIFDTPLLPFGSCYVMLFRFLYRGLTEISPRLGLKALRLWVWKGLFALRAYKKRLQRGELFPPFLFFAVTNACNLRCRGCWIATLGQPDSLPLADVNTAITAAAKQQVFFHTLLGGEPLLYDPIWSLIGDHPECYFQIITNGYMLDDTAAAKIRKLGNVSPLISIDGPKTANDDRRGEGCYDAAVAACRALQKQKILYGVATVVTRQNWEDVLDEKYIQQFIDLGAMYLWYYVFRPVGPQPSEELCVEPDTMILLRRHLLKLRKKMPIILIDTYWTAAGDAVCPAAKGLGFHIGPRGSIEPCPPLSVAKQRITDNGGDLFKTVNDSEFLRNFQNFVRKQYGDHPQSNGCVILNYPQELAEFFRSEQVEDFSGRDFLEELSRAESRPSHDLPGQEIPEDFWLYKILKKTLFFGMGGYG